MKKIKNIKQLAAEKKRLKLRQAELEKAIKYDWRDVKECIMPQSRGAGIFNAVTGKATGSENTGLLAESLSHLAAGFTKRTVQKAEERILHWFNKHKQ